MNVYLDSMQWIYFFEGNPLFQPQTRSMILRAKSAGSTFLASHLVLAEILVLPKRNNDVFTSAKYRHFFLSSAIVNVSFTPDVAERFAELRASTSVKPPDALHLALAASVGTDYFVSSDARLHSLTVPGIRNICPPDQVP